MIPPPNCGPLPFVKSTHILNKVPRQSITFISSGVLLFFHTSLVNSLKDQLLSFSAFSNPEYSWKLLASIISLRSQRHVHLNPTAYYKCRKFAILLNTFSLCTKKKYLVGHKSQLWARMPKKLLPPASFLGSFFRIGGLLLVESDPTR